MSTRAEFRCVAHVLLRDEVGRLALFRRAGTGFMDGWYGPPGGHQERGESVEAAARRECEEEAGVVPDPLRPVAVLPYVSGEHQGMNFVFAADCWQGEVQANPEVFDDLVWVSPAELPQRLPRRVVPWLATVLALEASGQWFEELRY